MSGAVAVSWVVASAFGAALIVSSFPAKSVPPKLARRAAALVAATLGCSIVLSSPSSVAGAALGAATALVGATILAFSPRLEGSGTDATREAGRVLCATAAFAGVGIAPSATSILIAWSTGAAILGSQSRVGARALLAAAGVFVALGLESFSSDSPAISALSLLASLPFTVRALQPSSASVPSMEDDGLRLLATLGLALGPFVRTGEIATGVPSAIVAAGAALAVGGAIANSASRRRTGLLSRSSIAPLGVGLAGVAAGAPVASVLLFAAASAASLVGAPREMRNDDSRTGRSADRPAERFVRVVALGVGRTLPLAWILGALIDGANDPLTLAALAVLGAILSFALAVSSESTVRAKRRFRRERRERRESTLTRSSRGGLGPLGSIPGIRSIARAVEPETMVALLALGASFAYVPAWLSTASPASLFAGLALAAGSALATFDPRPRRPRGLRPQLALRTRTMLSKRARKTSIALRGIVRETGSNAADFAWYLADELVLFRLPRALARATGSGALAFVRSLKSDDDRDPTDALLWTLLALVAVSLCAVLFGSSS